MESTVPELSQKSFRQMLAGLVEESADVDYKTYRKVAARICALLAAHYNRDALDPLKLWKRIESAVRLGVEKRTDDPGSLLSTALEHVKADPVRATKDPELSQLLAELDDASEEWMRGLCAYFRQSLYSAMVFGRQAWEERKQRTAGRLCPEDEAAARENGEKPTKLFDESEVQAALKARAAARGEEHE